MGKCLVGNVTLVLWTEAMAGNIVTELMPIFWWSKLKEEGRRKGQVVGQELKHGRHHQHGRQFRGEGR